jgi:hypothetical protein
MAFPRFIVRSSQGARNPGGTIAACLAAFLGSTIVSAAATSLPPGVQPCVTNVLPAGFGTLLLVESTSFAQTNDAAPAETSNPLPALVAEITSPSAFTVSNALLANARSFSLALPYQGAGLSSGATNFSSEADLLAALPAGTWNTSFQLVFTNGDSFVGFSVFNLSSNTAPVPQVANLAAAQAIDASAPFTLNWIPWIGSGTNDRISLAIVDAAGTTVASAATDCAGQSELAVGATGFTLPAGRLTPGASYTGYLTFGASRLADTDDGALLLQRSLNARTTRFPLRAIPGSSGPEGTLSRPVITASSLVMTLSGPAGTVYAVQASPDFAQWTEQTRATIPPSGSTEVTLPLPPTGGPRFYRAVAVGGGTTPDTGATLSLTLSGTNPTRLRMTVTGLPGSTHTIESTTNWLAWAEAGTVAIPEGSSNVVFTIAVPAGAVSAIYRARAGEVIPPPPTGKRPTLLATTAATGLQIALSGGDPNRTYTLQQANASFSAWSATTFTVTTDAAGAGQTTVTPLSATNGFFRVEAR